MFSNNQSSYSRLWSLLNALFIPGGFFPTPAVPVSDDGNAIEAFWPLPLRDYFKEFPEELVAIKEVALARNNTLFSSISEPAYGCQAIVIYEAAQHFSLETRRELLHSLLTNFGKELVLIDCLMEEDLITEILSQAGLPKICLYRLANCSLLEKIHNELAKKKLSAKRYTTFMLQLCQLALEGSSPITLPIDELATIIEQFCNNLRKTFAREVAAKSIKALVVCLSNYQCPDLYQRLANSANFLFNYWVFLNKPEKKIEELFNPGHIEFLTRAIRKNCQVQLGPFPETSDDNHSEYVIVMSLMEFIQERMKIMETGLVCVDLLKNYNTFLLTLDAEEMDVDDSPDSTMLDLQRINQFTIDFYRTSQEHLLSEIQTDLWDNIAEKMKNSSATCSFPKDDSATSIAQDDSLCISEGDASPSTTSFHL